MHMSVRVVSQPQWYDLTCECGEAEDDERFLYPITCGSPTEIEPVDYKDWQIQFIVSLDEDTIPTLPPLYEQMELTRIVRHIPNPYRGEGKPIDMSVVDMGKVRKTALMIVLLSEIGGVFFHCRKGKDRTGLVKAEVERILIPWRRVQSSQGEVSA